ARQFLPGLDEALLAENREWLQPAALDAEDRLVLCFQSYIVRTPHHVVLVDSCIGNDKQRPTRPIWHQKRDTAWRDGLAALGLGVEDIDVVMCTHLHADHVGWNTRLENGRWVPTFPRARYLFSRQELDFWQARHATTPIEAIADSVLPVVAAGRCDLVASDHVLDDHLRLLPTPGHTPDHFAVALGKGRRVAAITGDLIHSPLQARYPELSMVADVDPAQAAHTRRSFLEGMCDTGALCCFAHFPSPSRARLARWGQGFRCEPAG
ncbi:MAG: MBL fold metallo-hydrolase, partial [Rhodospirillales bacterium]|nr:MBL fold metallo-hydrolase [Rhodospirillales bacterium]